VKYQPGQTITPTRLPTVDGGTIDVPHPHQLTHLYFSRWAGCPICNMHIASYRRRADELRAANISVVMIFHSPAQDIIDLRGDLPFPLVADPDRTLYRAFGVGKSPLFLTHPQAWKAFRREAAQGNKAERVHGGVMGLPADFLIEPNGRLLAAHYGRHADDSLSVDDLLELQGRHADGPPRG
jgi:peroxiredoxin